MDKKALTKRAAVVAVALWTGVAAAVAQVSFGEARLFDAGWLFTLGDDSLALRVDYDDSRWRRLDLPHDWSVEALPSPTLASCTGYYPGGIGWYRKHFAWDGRSVDDIRRAGPDDAPTAGRRPRRGDVAAGVSGLTSGSSGAIVDASGLQPGPSDATAGVPGQSATSADDPEGMGADDGPRQCYIYFEGVYNRSSVYLNGHLLGYRPSGFSSFCYDMTPYLRPGDNVLAVRVDHSRQADCRWYTGSGIYRDVWAVTSAPVHIAQWGIGWTCERLSAGSATLRVGVAVEGLDAALAPSGQAEARPDGQAQSQSGRGQSPARGQTSPQSGRGQAQVHGAGGRAPGQGLTLHAELVDSLGHVVARARGKARAQSELTLTVARPHAWSLESPYVYRLRVTLADGARTVDAGEVPVGLRTLTFDADRGFALNGRWTKVKGVCLHHDAGVLGASVPADVWRRRLLQLKRMGANAIRMSHNPQAPAVYDLCDELGLLVLDEACDEWELPKRKWVEGWNVGRPSYDGSADYFDEWIDRDVADMVRRDRCHPSVFMWSIGNEVDYPNDPYSHPVLDGDGATISQPMYGGYDPSRPNAERIGQIAGRLAAVVRSVDRSRPVTGALAGVVMSNATAYPDAVDVVGYNYTEQRYDDDHRRYPRRILYGSETGVGYDAWRAVAERDFIFGQFVWTGTDYLGESGRWPSRGLHTGLLDFGSELKARGWFRASLWSSEPVCYVGTYPARRPGRRGGRDAGLTQDAPDLWNYEPGQEVRVVCYTDAAQARLTLDGREVGPLQARDAATGMIWWDVPFAPGHLTAEALDADGHVTATHTLVTSGRPCRLTARVDRTEMGTDRRVAHVTVEVVDDDGIPVRLADSDVTCRVEGPARLLGLENSDNADMGVGRAGHARVYRGRLLAYVQSVGTPGRVKVRFSSPLLIGTEVEIDVIDR